MKYAGKMHREKGSNQEMESQERESENGKDRENEIHIKEARSDSKLRCQNS